MDLSTHYWNKQQIINFLSQKIQNHSTIINKKVNPTYRVKAQKHDGSIMICLYENRFQRACNWTGGRFSDEFIKEFNRVTPLAHILHMIMYELL